MILRRCTFLLLLLTASLLCTRPAQAVLNVVLIFGSAWETELQRAASQAGVPAFSTGERDQIETMIHDAFLDAWQGYELNFLTVDPLGSRDRVDFGVATSNTNLLGSTQLDFGNRFQGIARVYPANFHWFLEPADDRQDQIVELATSLAGTAIHELSHSYGTRHVNAYGRPEVTPASYADTLGVQNQSFMATGPTGIDELGREQPRTLSEWSRVIMEVAEELTVAPVPLQFDFLAGMDAAAAQEVQLTYRQLANAQVGYVEGRIEAESDSDWFSFTVADPTRLTAEIWSDEWFSSSDDFDSRLRLVAPDGSTTLAVSEKIQYDADVFGPGSTIRGDDAFLLNIPLTAAGTYYLEISTIGNSGGPTPEGEYRLVMATLPIPEPSGWMMLVLSGLSLKRGHFASRNHAASRV